MPTKRPSKRILWPMEKRDQELIDRIISDQAQLWGISGSDAILRDIRESHLPKGQFARHFAECVYAGDHTLFGSIGKLLEWNVATGTNGCVAQLDYLWALEFGRQLIWAKDVNGLFPLNHDFSPHFVDRFESVIGRMEHELKQRGDAQQNYELAKAVEYGQALSNQANSKSLTTVLGGAYVDFAKKNFQLIGQWDDTCVYLSDLFAIYDDIVASRAKKQYPQISQDTPEQRMSWLDALERETASWKLM